MVIKKVISNLAFKILMFGISLILIVPVSVKLTDVIEETNEESISSTMENVKEIQKEAEDSIDGENDVIDSVEDESNNPLDVIRNVKSRVDQLTERTKNALQVAASSVVQLSEQAIKRHRIQLTTLWKLL